MLFGEGGHSGDGFSGAAMPDEQLGHFRRPQFGVRPQQGESLLKAPISSKIHTLLTVRPYMAGGSVPA
ncbi:hypothetical protein [Streptomyces chromofuscus]|uniref:hypothetical protein n=1 Tax=Streptomyces chromofuscus TaxID=42881 RepID=UPI001E2EF86E|nr:hypothetical protein [Streptomyces chromofuscus]